MPPPPPPVELITPPEIVIVVPSTFTPPSTLFEAVGSEYAAGIVGLLSICESPVIEFQSDFTFF